MTKNMQRHTFLKLKENQKKKKNTLKFFKSRYIEYREKWHNQPKNAFKNYDTEKN